MKSFNLIDAMAGEPLCLRNGTPVKFVAYVPEAREYEQIIVLSDTGSYYFYDSSGHTPGVRGDYDSDLVMVSKKVTSYVYHFRKRSDSLSYGWYISRLYASKKEAEESLTLMPSTDWEITPVTEYTFEV